MRYNYIYFREERALFLPPVFWRNNGEVRGLVYIPTEDDESFAERSIGVIDPPRTTKQYGLERETSGSKLLIRCYVSDFIYLTNDV